MEPRLDAYVSSVDVHVALAKHAPYPSLDIALVTARSLTERMALDKLRTTVLPIIQNMYQFHCLCYGELAKDARLYQRETWIGPLETVVEQYFDNMRDMLSISWLGSIDRLVPKDQAGVEKFATEFAKEAYAVMTWLADADEDGEVKGKAKTPAQLLSSIGIVRADLESYVDIRAPAHNYVEKEVIMPYDINALISEIYSNCQLYAIAGKSLHDLLDSASDSDAGLGASGLAGLSVQERHAEKHAALKALRAEVGFETMAHMIENGLTRPSAAPVNTPAAPVLALDLAAFGIGAPVAPAPVTVAPVAPAVDLSAFTGGALQPPPATATPPVAQPVLSAPAPLPPAAAGPLIDGGMLTALRDVTGVKSDDLGKLVGVSRATFDNYCKGKGKLHATPANKEALAKFVQVRLDALNQITAYLAAL